MKAVLLAGGRGTRLYEQTDRLPKPMVEVAGRPILWHIMKYYSSFGINDFIICCGYRGYVIKEYFANYFLHMSDVTFDMEQNSMEVHERHAEPWRVTLVDTGESTLTGGRLKRVAPYLLKEPEFCFTYGDGLSDIDIAASVEFHRREARLATVTAVRPPGRYGTLETDGNRVTAFTEKPPGDGASINGGFFVLSPKCLDRISGDGSSWEGEPLQSLARDNQLAVFRHDGFWQPMDTLRDLRNLEELWSTGRAPWRRWT